MEIIQKNTKGFNRSSKIMEHKLGINESRLLNTLIYKHNYWNSEGELIKIDKGWGFYITIPNLQGETNLSPSVIKRCIDALKKYGLIEVYRKGIPAKNHYVLNKQAIESFDEKHESEYESWIDSLGYKAEADRSRFERRRGINVDITSVPHIESQLGQNDPTGEVKMTQQEGSKTCVTNNKKTNNKKLKTITNRINAVERDYPQLDELTKAITRFRESNDVDGEAHESLFHLMKNLVPRFVNFGESHKDSIMINRFCDYSLDSNAIAFKILSNAHDIIDGTKKNRFGNLFVGLEEMNEKRGILITCYGS